MTKKYVPSGYQIFNIHVANFNDSIENDELLEYCRKCYKREDVKPLLIKLDVDENRISITSFAQVVVNLDDETLEMILGQTYIETNLVTVVLSYDYTIPEIVLLSIE